MKKVICFCILLFISLLVGCMDSGIEIDPTKTQLYIQYFDGGVGGEWLDKVISRFEEEYAGYEFESGKNGAEIIPIPTKSVMLYTVPNSTYNLYFTEDVDYFTYASQGFFLDISDIVSEKNISSENNTIESKLNEIFKTSLTSIDGNYYAIPHYEFFHSVMYDVDLFEEKKLFFADNRDNGNNGFIIKSDDKRSAGLDG
ncbi:MAG: extracellular solute-binding protein, partial [Bacilli bacterium]|nr:extracellular solute-binding protein [Bacilli bacterium]